MSEPSCCESCLRRTLLVGFLAPLIETVSSGRPGRRSPELLALDDGDLAAAVAGCDGGAIVEQVGRRDLTAARASMKASGLWACCRHDGAYPEVLRGDRQAPAALLGRGDAGLLAELGPDRAITIVGARRASAHGGEVARALGAELATAGLTVISGMALGIDSRAHEGALGAGGRTVAVLGSGPDVPHPRSRLRLYEQIAARGLILSELPPGTRPYRWSFPARNRIMAALGGMTVVVEAAARSGSLITAEMAGDLGREVGAVPGSVGAPLSEGTNALLADGAVLVRDAQDVLDAMLGAGAPRLPRRGPDLSERQASVLALVGRGHETADAIAGAAGIAVGETAAALAGLELRGCVRCDSAGRYRTASNSASAHS
ncbi:MAG: DNA-processing protein DprA [Solirubrobacterales bacterium]